MSFEGSGLSVRSRITTSFKVDKPLIFSYKDSTEVQKTPKGVPIEEICMPLTLVLLKQS